MASDDTGEPIVWKSSSPGVVSISQSGAVTCFAKKGTVTVTATRGKLRTTVRLRVYQPTTSFALNNSDFWIHEGKTMTLRPTLSKGSDEPVMWESLNGSVATVTDKGVVKGVSQGSATIRATTACGLVREATVLVRSKAAVFEWSTVPAGMKPRSSVNYGVGIDGTKDLYAAITAPAGCNDTITWSVSSKSVLSLSNVGGDQTRVRIMGLRKGNASVTARTGSGRKITYQIAVVEDGGSYLLLNKHEAVMYKGSALTVSATANPRGSVVLWKSFDPSVATVDENGRITAVANGWTTVRAYFSYGSDQYDQIDIHVITKATSIAVDYDTIYLLSGESVRNRAMLEPIGCGDSVTWTSSNKSVAVVSEVREGVVDIIGVSYGSCTVTAKTGSGKTRKIRVYVF